MIAEAMQHEDDTRMILVHVRGTRVHIGNCTVKLFVKKSRVLRFWWWWCCGAYSMMLWAWWPRTRYVLQLLAVVIVWWCCSSARCCVGASTRMLWRRINECVRSSYYCCTAVQSAPLYVYDSSTAVLLNFDVWCDLWIRQLGYYGYDLLVPADKTNGWQELVHL